MNDYQTHVDAAKELLRDAQADEEEYGIVRSELLAEAQVHATLALAAATRDADPHQGVVTVQYAGQI